MKYYRRTIIYTKCPLRGAFSYRDKFILQPITRTEIPHCPYAKHFPAFLDVCYEADEGLGEFDLVQKDIDVSNRFCNILTALSNFEFFTYQASATIWGRSAPSVRVEEMTEDEVASMNESTCNWIIAVGYTYPEYVQDRIIHSLNVLEGNGLISSDSNPSYFTDNPIQEEKEEVSLPKKVTDALDTFFSLDEEKRDSVYSAIVLVSDGIRLGLSHQSLGFVSFISSIETMIDLEYKGVKVGHCKLCGQPQHSVSKKFLDYLSRYVSKTDNSKRKFRRLYSLRSKIAHSGKLFVSDKEFSLLNKDEMNSEWFTYMEAQQLARLSLFRWLLLNKS